jgi:hypothetical protein
MPSAKDISYTPIQKSEGADAKTRVGSPPTSYERPVEWRISVWSPASMLALFISGLLVSIGHHLFYSRLNGTLVNGPDDGSQYLTQIWIIRYGTAFAFLAKALLASAVVVAYKQHIWISMRTKANTISTIDAMFGATHDLLVFLRPSFVLRARIPALMALVAWYLAHCTLTLFKSDIYVTIGFYHSPHL